MATTQRATSDLAAAKAEIFAARSKYQSLLAELTTLRAQLAAANERVAALEAELAATISAHALSLEERDGIINGLRYGKLVCYLHLWTDVFIPLFIGSLIHSIIFHSLLSRKKVYLHLLLRISPLLEMLDRFKKTTN